MMLYFLSGSGIMGILLSERFRLDVVQELDEAGRRRYFVAGELCVRHVLAAVDLGHVARPQFIAYKIAPKPFPVKLCEALGAMKVCWTSHEWANEKGNDTVIFEFYKPKLKFNKR